MPMGAKNSPRTMERLLGKLLKGTSKFANYLQDDIIISSNNFADHLSHIRAILERLRAANLTASISKSEFLITELEVLGRVIKNGTILPSQRHIDAINRIGPQRTKQGVRGILGLVNYHSQFIPNLAEITCCLTNLLKRGEPEKNIKWQQKHSDALETIKRIMTSKPVLIAPRHDKDFIIMTDAMNTAVSGILAQADDQGCERNVAYYSRKLLPREINFSTIEKECLAVVATITN
jgi:hypothetical protein